MKTLNLTQGSAEWHAHRRTHRNASDASVVMGASKNMARNELIRILATGSEREYSRYVEEVVFARGHAVEAAARPMAEQIIGEDLYPVVGVHEDCQHSASFDGLTMDERIAFECKQWNEEKAAIVRTGKVPPEDLWQCVQELYVSGAEKLLYMVTDGTPAKCAHCWLVADAKREKDLLAGWAQFECDVADYKPAPRSEVVLAEAQESLPAVAVKLDGALAVTSNLDLFGDRLKAFIDGIKKKPDTDQEFANCEAAVKTLKKAEEALEAAEASALAQIDPVEAMRRTVADYRETARTTRLLLEKVVKSRKDEIRQEILLAAVQAWNQHTATINARLKRVRITVAAPDFAGAMKGKKTIDGLRSGVDDLMARAKIEASHQADDMAKNLATIDELAKEHAFLVRDLQDLVSINPEHLAGVVRGRIADHEKAEAARLEADRERIRKEEEARAQREAEKLAEQERHRIRQEEQAKARAEQQAEASKAGQARQQTVAPAAAPVATTKQAPAAAVRPATKTRPTDAEIIEVLALHYRVHESKVIEWLLEVDLNSASKAMAEAI